MNHRDATTDVPAPQLFVDGQRFPEGSNFDGDGNLYFTDPGLGDLTVPGDIYRWSPTGSLSLVASGLLYPNGIAHNEAEDALFVAETGGNRIVRFPIGPSGWRVPVAARSALGFGFFGLVERCRKIASREAREANDGETNRGDLPW